MPISPEQFKTTEELKREMAALKLRIAFQEAEERRQMQMQKAASEDVSLNAAFAQIAPSALAAIRRSLRRDRARHALTKTLPRVGRVAAALLLVFYIGLSTAVATVESVRISFAKFIMNIGSEYAELGFDDTSVEYAEVPAEWPGSYYPSYIPEGFVLRETDRNLWEVEFSDAVGNRLSFSELGPDTYTNIDTEDSELEFIELHGAQALVAEKAGRTFVTWSVDNRYFIVRLEGPRQEAIEIARSVRMIK